MISLKKQTFSGIIWTIADTFILKGLFFVATIVLARLLGPTEFGLVGMISIFIAIGTSLVDSGLSSSIIRTKDSDHLDYSTVFLMNLGMSIVIYLVLFFAAPFIAEFYKQELLINIIRVYCLTFVISAFSAVHLAILFKNMQFKKIMQINSPGIIIGVIVGIAAGYLGYGVWSIIYMYLVTQIIQSVVLWFTSSWKPKLNFSLSKAQYHYNFGYKLMLSGLLDTVFKNIYNVIIGKFYSVQSLGYYERAKSLNEYPVATLTGIISKVSYPLLSQIQDDKDKISTVYRQLMQVTFFVTAPLMLGLSAVAKPLFLLILGKEWLPAAPFFQILCLAGMFYPVHAFNINILKVYGRSDLFLRLEIIKKIITTVSIFVMFQFGLLGLVWSGVIVSVVALVINTHYSSDMIYYSTKRQFLDMIPIIITSGAMFFAVLFLIGQLAGYSLYIQIIVPTLGGILLYIGVNILIKSPTLLYTFNLLKQYKS